MKSILSAKESTENGLRIITFPAEAMQDLHLFVKEGLIDWVETETGSLSITKGDIICFEKSEKIYRVLTKKLSRVKVYREFGAFITNQYKMLLKSTEIFPVDVVNLDYEKNISKNEVPIDIIIRYLFEFQSKHRKNFALFITWPIPNTPEDDEVTFIDQLKSVIVNNLSDINAKSFKESFISIYKSIDKMEYHPLSIIGLTKLILRQSSTFKFRLHSNEYYVYGEERKRKMISVLYRFDYDNTSKTISNLYSQDVAKALAEIEQL